MNKLDEMILTNIKYIKGDILTLGLSDELNDNIKKRTNIKELYTINKKDNENIDDAKDKESTSNFDIKRLNKFFISKQLDYTICNLDLVDTYFPFFIKDIINLNDEKILIFGSNNIHDKDIILKQLKRYKNKIEIIDDSVYFIYIFSTKNMTISCFRKLIYFIEDVLLILVDKTGDILTR